jgi:beta-glucosidase/6-phospho-beta-glucosidase/beta-galactosidase
VTENGVATDDDEVRQRYLIEHIHELEKARQDGYDIRGYFHWTLVDNFEWSSGYTQKYGLYSLDRDSHQIVPKPSAMLYKSIIADHLSQEGGDSNSVGNQDSTTTNLMELPVR